MERSKLIDAIVKYSGEELNEFSQNDFIDLAKESNEQLLDRLISILEWYENEVKELNEAITQ
jgi:hypothetical protein